MSLTLVLNAHLSVVLTRRDDVASPAVKFPGNPCEPSLCLHKLHQVSFSTSHLSNDSIRGSLLNTSGRICYAETREQLQRQRLRFILILNAEELKPVSLPLLYF